MPYSAVPAAFVSGVAYSTDAPPAASWDYQAGQAFPPQGHELVVYNAQGVPVSSGETSPYRSDVLSGFMCQTIGRRANIVGALCSTFSTLCLHGVLPHLFEAHRCWGRR